jgi:hypothetical protein
MKSLCLRLLVLTASALALAACQFQAATTIEPDGSGELRTEVGFTAEERKNLEAQSGGSSPDFCNTQGSASGVTVTEETRGDQTWCVTIRKFNNPDELRKLYAEQKGITIHRLELADEKFYYDVDVDTASDESSFSAFSAITWTVTLPGAPLTHNAAQAQGNTLTWNLPPKSGMLNLRAESAVDRPDTMPLWIMAGVGLLCIALSIAAVGVGAVLLARRARKPSSSSP